MVDFNYTYLSLDEVITLIPQMNTYGIWEYAVWLSITVFLVCFIFFVFPALYSIGNYREKEKQKRTRKNLLKQIALQKDIEDSIDSEVS